MKLKKIKVKNIRSYKDEEVIFPEGSLLLSGDIGSGKTSILMAIEYALFGLQPGQKGAALLRNNVSEGSVILDLEAAGKTISIERRLKRTIKGVSNDYAAITVNGERIESSVTEIKSKIIELLGYPPEFVKKNNLLYRYTVHTAQEQMKQIITEDSETRLNILRHIFGIEKYLKIKSNIAILVTNLKGDARILQGEISTLESDRENVVQRKLKLESIQQLINVKKEELDLKKETRKKVQLELEEISGTVKEKSKLESEIEKTMILYSTKRELLSSVLIEEEDLRKTISEEQQFPSKEDPKVYHERARQRKEELDKLNLGNLGLMVKQKTLTKEMQDFLSKKERIFKLDLCPTCLQNVSEVHKHNILNDTERRMVEIKKELENLESERNKILFGITSLKLEISSLEDEMFKAEVFKSKLTQIEKSKKRMALLAKQKDSIEKDKEMLLAHINFLKEEVLKYSFYDIKFKKKEEELKESIRDEKNVEISVAELVRELDISKREIIFWEETIQRKEDSKKKLERLNELVDWLSTRFSNLIELIERNVLLRLRNDFSTLFRKWFLMLVSENSLDSQIDDNFTPIIIQGETEMDYSFLSGGERTAVALAYRLALNQTINSALSKIKTRGLIILDEPTDGFSEAQINKIRDILEELNAEQLIIVSHEQKIESFVDNVLRVTKEGEDSRIEQSIQG